MSKVENFLVTFLIHSITFLILVATFLIPPLSKHLSHHPHTHTHPDYLVVTGTSLSLCLDCSPISLWQRPCHIHPAQVTILTLLLHQLRIHNPVWLLTAKLSLYSNIQNYSRATLVSPLSCLLILHSKFRKGLLHPGGIWGLVDPGPRSHSV